MGFYLWKTLSQLASLIPLSFIEMAPRSMRCMELRHKLHSLSTGLYF